ncbi:MAG: hypothetical protein NTU53_20705 [Planctomycetota bacterium]|nr:hypothetical protein [Planctomycetota bacterium]
MKNTIDSSRVTRLGLADVVDRALARAVRSVLLAAPNTLELLEPRTLLTAAPLGQEFLVNQRDLGGEATREPAVAMDVGGDSVVVWDAFSGPYALHSVYLRRYNSAGQAIGDQVKLDGLPNQDAFDPDVAMDSQGNFVIAWTTLDRNNWADYSIDAQRFAASGQALGQALHVNTQTIRVNGHPSVAMAPDGRFVVAWEQTKYDTCPTYIHARYYDSQGSPVTGEFDVTMFTLGYRHFPSAAMDRDGDFVVAWQSYEPSEEAQGIRARRFDNTGQPLTDEFRVTDATGYSRSYPDVAMDPSGGFMVTSIGIDSNQNPIYARCYSAAGEAGHEFILSVRGAATSFDSGPAVAMDAHGQSATAWIADRGQGIVARVFDGTTPLTNELSVTSAGSASQPDIAMDADGSFVVVWARNPGTGSENGIFARRYEQTAPATASVGDRVWLDEDGNGVQDAGESGFMGVSVDLLDEDGVVASTVTDYGGYYDFDGLPAGDSYYLRFNLPQGYVFSPQDQGAHDALDSDANVETGKTAVFMLWPGVADMTHDAGMKRIPRGEIEAMLYNDLDADGRRDVDEMALAAWTVYLDANSNGQRDPNEAFTTTDANGICRFVGLSPASYRVAVEPIAPWTPTEPAGASVVVAVAAGVTTTQLFGFHLIPATLGGLAWKDLDVDGIRDAGDPVLQGVDVRLYLTTGVLVNQTQSGSDGRYRFESVRPLQPYFIEFVCPHGLLFTLQGQDSDVNIDTGRTDSFPVHPGEMSLWYDAGFILESSVSGKAVNDLDGDGAQDAEEGGLAGRTIYLDGDRDGELDAGEVSTKTDATGAYTIGGLRPGAYRVAQVVLHHWKQTWPAEPHYYDANLLGSSAEGLTFGNVPVPWTAYEQGGEFRVNTFTPDYQGMQDVAIDADGDFVVVWTSAAHDGSDYGIFAQLYNSAGNRIGGEFQVNVVTSGEQREPSVAMDPKGNFVVVWRSEEPDDKDRVVIRRYDALGSPVSGEIDAITARSSTGYNPDIAMDADGDCVVAWSGYGGRIGVDLFARRFNSLGQPQGDVFDVNSAAAGQQSSPVAAMDDDGNFVIAWATFSDDYKEADVYAQRFDASGTRLGSEFRVNTYTDRWQIWQSIAIDADGDFVIVWESLYQGEGGFDIYGQRFDSTGARQGGEFRVNDFTDSNQTFPTVAMDADGDFVVAYQTSPDPNNQYEIYAKRYNAAGDSLGAEFRVNTTLINSQHEAVIAMNAVGDFIVTWQSNLQDGSNEGVYAQRYWEVSNYATLSGIAWDDANADGVRQPDEAFTDHVAVNLYAAGGAHLATAWPDPQGVFRFEELRADRSYYLQFVPVTVDGWLLTNPDQGTDDSLDSDVQLNGYTPPFAIAVGQTAISRDVGLFKQARISGTVYNDLDNDGVLSPGEGPLEGWTIYLDNGNAAPDEFEPRAISDTQGRYTFTGLRPGTYRVAQIIQQNWVQNEPGGCFHVLTLGAGQSATGVDFLNHRAGSDLRASVGNQVWVDTFGDSVRGSDDPGIDGVVIKLLSTAGIVLETTTTSGGGLYRFDGLTPDVPYALQFVAPDGFLFTRQDQGTDDAADSDPDMLTGQTPSFALHAGQIDLTWDLGLVRGGTITGTIYNDLNLNGQRDFGEPGMPGQSIYADTNHSGRFDADDASALTDANGNYRLTRVRPGEFQVLLAVSTGWSATMPVGGIYDATLYPAELLSGIDFGIRCDPFTSVSPAGGEFGVKTVALSHPTDPEVAMDSQGDFVIVWQSRYLDGDGYGVFFRRYDSDGQPLGEQIIANTITVGDQRSPSIAMDTDGDFAIAWVSHKTDQNEDGAIYVRLFNADGTPQGAETKVSGNGYGVDNPSVAMDPDGDFVVAWEQPYTSNGHAILAQRFDRQGNPLGATLTMPKGSQYSYPMYPVAAMDAQGNFVIAWGMDGIQFQRFTASGQSLGGLIRADQHTQGPGTPFICSLAMDPAGNFAVAWTDWLKDGSKNCSFARLFNAAGVPKGPEFQVNSYVLDDQVHPRVAIAATGEFVIAWFSGAWPADGQDGSGNGVYAQRYTPAGLPDGPEFRVNTNTQGDQQYPVAAMDADGDFVIAWQDYGVADIRAQRYHRTVNPAAVGGIVWDDDENGIRTDNEAGLPGRTVRLYTESGTLIATTTTDDAGHYRFDDLFPGQRYYLQFIPGQGAVFTDAHQGADDTRDSDADPATGRTPAFMLLPGQTDLTQDAGLLWSSFIWGTVYSDLNGNGSQDPNEPAIPNWTVYIDTNADGEFDDGEPSATADPDGQYVFGDLRPGTYRIALVLEENWMFTAPSDGYRVATVESDDSSVGNNFGVPLRPSSVGGIVWMDSDYNGIRDEANVVGFGGFTVSLMTGGGVFVASTTTDSSGKYRFDGLTPGQSYYVFLHPATGLFFTLQNRGLNDAIDSDADPITGHTATFVLDPGQIDLTWDVGVLLPSSITGSVYLDSNGNGRWDPGETGVGNRIVYIDTNGDGRFQDDGSEPNRVTGLLSSYEINNLLPGTYRLGLVARDGWQQTAPVGGWHTITIGSNQIASGYDFGTRGIPETASVGGIVWNDLNGDGIRNPNSQEHGWPDIDVCLFTASGRLVAATRTNGEGRYHFDDLLPGQTYYIQVVFTWLKGVFFTLQDQGGDDTRDSDVNPVIGKTAVFTLRPGQADLTKDAGVVVAAKIIGFVYNDLDGNGTRDDGEPGLDGRTVYIDANANGHLDAGERSTTSAANGTYVMEYVRPGTYRIAQLPRDGWRLTEPSTGFHTVMLKPHEVSAPLAFGNARRIPTASVGGRQWEDLNVNGIQDDGEPTLGLGRVTLYAPDGREVASADGGEYRFDHVEPGSYYLQFQRLSGMIATHPHRGDDDALDSDIDPATYRTPVFTLTSGQVDLHEDAGVFHQADIWLYAFNDLDSNGKWNDPAEQGLGGFEFFIDSNANGRLDEGERSFASDVSGRVHLEDLWPGVYRLAQVAQPAWVRTVPAEGYYSIDVRPDAVFELLFGYKPTSTGIMPTGPEFRANTLTAGNQYQPASAMDADGDFVLAWVSDPRDSSGATIQAQRYSSTGEARGPQLLVSSASAVADPQWPHVAMDADGDFAVAWADNPGVYVRRYNAAGEPQGASFTIPASLGGSVSWVDAAMDRDGDFAVTWMSMPHSEKFEVLTQRFDAAGVAQGPELRISPPIGERYVYPAVAMDDDGAFVVAWTARQEGSNIYAQRYSPAGEILGPSISVSQGQQAQEVSAAMDAHGAFVISWVVLTPPGGGDTAIYARQYNPAGETLGPAFRVDTFAAQGQHTPSVAMDADGDFVISWENCNPDADRYGVYARRYNAARLPFGSEFLVNTRTAGSQYNPSVAADANGNFVIAWTSEQQDGSGTGVYVQRYELTAQPTIVGGMLWIDADGDGVRDVLESGVDAATISLFTEAGALAAVTNSDAHGLYRFTGLHVGQSYYLQFLSLPGHAFTAQGQGTDESRDSDVDIATGRTPLFTLATGHVDLSTDAGLVPAPRIVELHGTPGDDTFVITRGIASLAIRLNGATEPTWSVPIATTAEVRVFGDDGNDTFALVNFTLGRCKLILDGGTGTERADSGDRIVLSGLTGQTVLSEPSGTEPGGGRLTVRESEIPYVARYVVDYAGIEHVEVSPEVRTSVTIVTPNPDDQLTLMQDDDQRLLISGTSGGVAIAPMWIGEELPLLVIDLGSHDAGAGNDLITIPAGMPDETNLQIISGTGNNSVAVGAGRVVLPPLCGNFALTAAGDSNVTIYTDTGVTVLNIRDSAHVTVKADISHTLRLKGLSISEKGMLDLGGNELIVGIAGTPPRDSLDPRQALLFQLSNYIADARITTTEVSPVPFKGLGATVLSPSRQAAAETGTIDPLSIDEFAVLVKYTWNGDANLDGMVNADDYFQIDSGFIAQKKGWYNGDFNYDNVVNADDYFLIDSAFIGQSGPLSASKPKAASSADVVAMRQAAKKAEPDGILSQLFSTEPAL